jgi:hypothetical protein
MAVKDKLDALIAQHFREDARAHERDDRDASERVLAALSHRLPPQRRAWRLWPAALLDDWDFAPAWPRVAALASCAVLGFAIGVASPILRDHDASAAATMRGDLGSVMSEPEPLTGVLP